MPFSLGEIFREVYIPIILVTVAASVIPVGIYFSMPYGWIRFLVVGFASVLCTSAAVLWIGCKKSERRFLIDTIAARLRIKKNDPDETTTDIH